MPPPTALERASSTNNDRQHVGSLCTEIALCAARLRHLKYSNVRAAQHPRRSAQHTAIRRPRSTQLPVQKLLAHKANQISKKHQAQFHQGNFLLFSSTKSTTDMEYHVGDKATSSNLDDPECGPSSQLKPQAMIAVTSARAIRMTTNNSRDQQSPSSITSFQSAHHTAEVDHGFNNPSSWEKQGPVRHSCYTPAGLKSFPSTCV